MKYLSLVIYVIMIIVNLLINLMKKADIVENNIIKSYSNLLTPTNITNVIIPIVYLGLLLYILYSIDIIENENTREERRIFNNINLIFVSNMILNILWNIFNYYNKIFASVLIMILMLFTLYKISFIINDFTLDERQNIFIKIPFNLYFGVITVSSIINVLALFVDLGLKPFNVFAIIISSILLILGIIISIYFFKTNRDGIYILAVAWIYIGIFINQVSENGFNRNFPLLIFIGISSILVLFYVLFKEKRIIS